MFVETDTPKQVLKNENQNNTVWKEVLKPLYTDGQVTTDWKSEREQWSTKWLYAEPGQEAKQQ